jgi:hypothetical protein
MQAAVCAGIEVGGTGYYVYENEDGMYVRRGGRTSEPEMVDVGARAMTKTSHMQDTGNLLYAALQRA